MAKLQEMPYELSLHVTSACSSVPFSEPRLLCLLTSPRVLYSSSFEPQKLHSCTPMELIRPIHEYCCAAALRTQKEWARGMPGSKGARVLMGEASNENRVMNRVMGKGGCDRQSLSDTKWSCLTYVDSTIENSKYHHSGDNAYSQRLKATMSWAYKEEKDQCTRDEVIKRNMWIHNEFFIAVNPNS